MNKKGIFIIAISLIITLLAGSYWYFKNQQNTAVSATDAVPLNAAAIVEIKDVATLFKKCKSSKVYTNLKQIDNTKELLSNIVVVDSLLSNNIELATTFKGLPLIVSFHSTSTTNYSPLAIMAFSSNSHGKRALDHIIQIIEPYGKIATTKYEQAKIYNYISNNNPNNQHFITFYQGYLIASSNEMLLQEAIRQIVSGFNLTQNPSFVKLKQWAGRNVDANIYLQFKNLNPFIQKQFVNNLFSNFAIQTFSDWGGFDLSIKTDNWLINGFSIQNVAQNQWSQIFKGQAPVASDLTKKVPLGINGFTWIGLSNFNKFQRSLESYMENIGQLSRYRSNIESVKNTYGNLVMSTIEENFHNGIMQVAMPDGSTIFVVETKGKYEARNLFDYFTNGKTPSLSVKEFKIDNDTRFNIHEMALSQIPTRIFGPWFSQSQANYIGTYENCIIFGDTHTTIGRFIYDNILHKKLQYDADFDQFGNSITNKSNFYTFVSLTNSETLLSRILSNKNFAQYRNNQAVFYNLYGLVWQFSSEENYLYHNTFIRHQPSRSNTTSTHWETHLDTLAAFKPALVDNHNTGEKEIFIQDLRNNIYLINAAGRILWKKQIGEPIIGGVQQIDYYKNGKLQLFFNTATKLYLIDRNGNHVERYPITLPSTTSLPVSVFDYTKNKNYRLFVQCDNSDIHIFSIDGKTLPDFTLKKANQKPIVQAQHFIVNDKDYISITDTAHIYLIDRRGNLRVQFSGNIRPSANNELKYLKATADSAAMLVRTSNDGTLCFLHFDGKITYRKVGSFSPKHYFDIENICGDTQPELIFADSNIVSVYSFDGKKLFERRFDDNITLRPAFYKLTSTQTAIGITESESGNIYLIDSKGNTLSGFPLRGKTRFSIGILQSGQSYYNLIVGGNDQYLFNYKITK